MKQNNCISSSLTGQTGHPHRSDRWTRSPSTWELHRSDRCPSPVRPMPPRKLPKLKNSSKPLGNLLNVPRCPKHAQTSPPCWQCMNQGKMRKVSTYSFSNIQNSSQGATHVQMSKLDTLQVRNDLDYMITKFHNHWTRLKKIWAILQKFTLSWAKS
jgi:hypothetical protein